MFQRTTMSDDKPSALRDVRTGLGLLFRAARTAVGKLPAGGVEEVVVTSAREVGRAFENVASAIERELRGKRGGTADENPPGQAAPEAPREKPEPPNPAG